MFDAFRASMAPRAAETNVRAAIDALFEVDLKTAAAPDWTAAVQRLSECITSSSDEREVTHVREAIATGRTRDFLVEGSRKFGTVVEHDSADSASLTRQLFGTILVDLTGGDSPFIDCLLGTPDVRDTLVRFAHAATSPAERRWIASALSNFIVAGSMLLHSGPPVEAPAWMQTDPERAAQNADSGRRLCEIFGSDSVLDALLALGLTADAMHDDLIMAVGAGLSNFAAAGQDQATRLATTKVGDVVVSMALAASSESVVGVAAAIANMASGDSVDADTEAALRTPAMRNALLRLMSISVDDDSRQSVYEAALNLCGGDVATMQTFLKPTAPTNG